VSLWTDARRVVRRNLQQGFPYWTTAAIVMCLGMFALELTMSSDAMPSGPMPNPFVLDRLGMLDGPRVHYLHEWWRLVTPILLHGSVMHILMNSIGLWQLGSFVEAKFGTLRAIVVFVVTGIVGNVATYTLLGDRALSVGASGAIFGYIGVALGFALRRRERSLQEQLVPMAIYGVIMSFLPHIDWRAHFGGGLAGMALGAVIGDRRTAHRLKSWIWVVLAVVAIAVLVGAVIVAGMHPQRIPVVDES
jgi:membrane associated rhomboid family serine protease